VSARSLGLRSDESGILPTDQRPIRVLVVGGLTRLDPFYRAAPAGIEIDAVYVDCPSLETRAEAADALVLVVGNVSHSAAAKVRSIARRRGTPLASATGASVSRVRASIALAYAAARDGEDGPTSSRFSFDGRSRLA
jgi:Uncharacterized protein conserved in bacteria (DUF2325)